MSGETIGGIRSRINSIRSAQKISKAMFLSASAKYNRALRSMEGSSGFKIHAQRVLEVLVPYLKTNEGRGKICRFVIAGDRGMSGGYNNAVFRKLREESEKGCCYLPIGKKAWDRLVTENREIISEKMVQSEKTGFDEIKKHTDMIVQRIKTGDVCGVDVIYTAFSGELRREDIIVPGKHTKNSNVLFEPEAEEIIGKRISDLIAGVMYANVCEANAREQLSRRIAMDAAEKNAQEMLEDMRLRLNRKRQNGITQEIIEAVSGYVMENRGG